MSKTLITKQNYRDFLDPNEKEIYICNMMILTPGAKDSLREKQIKIIYDNQLDDNPKPKVGEKVQARTPEETSFHHDDSSLTNRIYRLMKDEFKTDNYSLAERIAKLITTR